MHPRLWAIAGGLCLSAAFPNANAAGLAWIAPGMMLFAGLIEPRHAFRTGYVAGLVHHLASLYWLLNIPVPFAPALGWLLLSAYLALFSGAWVWFCVRLAPDALPRPWRSEADFPTAGTPLETRAHARPKLPGGPARLRWAISCAAAWVALEMLRGWLLTGFPWNFLGASQYRQIPLIQIASFSGVPGVSFVVAWMSVALLGAVLAFWRAPASRAWRTDLVLPVIVTVAAIAFGLAKAFEPQPPERTVSLALIQPSIPQTLIWNPSENTNRFRRLLDLSTRALAEKPDVLVWPEAAVPNLLRHDKDTFDAVTGLARQHGVWMIVGADDAEPRRGDATGREADFFNSSFLISPRGELFARYDKRRLVVFGEYVPLARWLPFLKWFTPITGGFSQGRAAVPFVTDGPRFKTSVLICFEDVFAALARGSVEPDTDFLVNLTNNGWFGESAAQWQHAAAAVFRAVENGLPLVRCTNNGLTCWVDRLGVIRDAGVDGGGIYGEGFRVVKIPLLPENGRRPPTFYHRHGGVFGWACAGLSTLMLARLLRRKTAAGEARP